MLKALPTCLEHTECVSCLSADIQAFNVSIESSPKVTFTLIRDREKTSDQKERKEKQNKTQNNDDEKSLSMEEYIFGFIFMCFLVHLVSRIESMFDGNGSQATRLDPSWL